ncbi:hypothetical protein [Sphingobacterium athyrii]|uniref:hypothetical protein n=1 Tax=Sphingobacterium athyrii TaxID=2152717 RepID=UPI001FE75691|nr:hypothetical protein [Sphingobacterium athyrii]
MKFKLLLYAQAFVLALMAPNSGSAQPKSQDWLISKTAQYQSRIAVDGKNIVLENGLVRRSFWIRPNAFCYDFTNLITGQQLIRAVQPEAQLQLNGKWYNVGGVDGQKERAYLRPEWMPTFTTKPEDFSYVKH